VIDGIAATARELVDTLGALQPDAAVDMQWLNCILVGLYRQALALRAHGCESRPASGVARPRPLSRAAHLHHDASVQHAVDQDA
jgi:hypothetical protein